MRNLGLSLAAGEYVLFLDADDWYSEGLLERLNEVIDEHSSAIDVIEFRYRLFNNSTGEFQAASWLDRGEDGIKHVANQNIMLATGSCNKCWKRSFLEINGLKFCETNRSGEEIPLHISAFLKAKSFFYLNFVGHTWRIHSTSLSHNLKGLESFLNGVWDVLTILKKELLRLNIYSEENYLSYCSTILRWHLNEKFSLTKPYIHYYLNCRRFFKLNKLKPISCGHIFKLLSKRIRGKQL